MAPSALTALVVASGLAGRAMVEPARTPLSMPPSMCTLPPAHDRTFTPHRSTTTPSGMPPLAEPPPAADALPLRVPPPVVTPDDLDHLRARRLTIPVAGVAREALHDSFAELRDLRRHEAIDLVAPVGTPVAAVEGGTIAKLFVSVPGGLTIYHLDPTSTYVYYYAHLDRYAEGLHEGQAVERGQVIGYVGVTGNAAGTPHLHFAISKLGPGKRWWEGAPINPYPVLR
jgi:murein DD-endopeptidase MepM/ murein hydrolase activator NlpD